MRAIVFMLLATKEAKHTTEEEKRTGEPRQVRRDANQTSAPKRTVAQVTWSLVAGGAEMYALTIASNLDSRKYASVICAVDQGGALESEISRLPIPYYILHRRPGIRLGVIWRLYQIFRRCRVRVVHTHHFNQLFYSLIGAKLAGAKIIHTEHSVEAYKRRRLRLALRVLSVFCDRIIAIGSDGAGVLRDQVGIPARKLEIIRAGVDTQAAAMPKAEARAALGLNESDGVVAIVARLFPEKNHALLLQAFAQTAERSEGARLLIVGEGVERDAIRNEIARLGLGGSVQMLGVRRDVARILAAADVFVLSSDREGLPIAVLEAMAAGRPVVATAVGDLPLVVQDGVNGRIVPAQDPSAMAAALIEMLSDPARAAEMGARGRRIVKERYGLAAMISRYEEIYGPI